jgi:hypothetical protein
MKVLRPLFVAATLSACVIASLSSFALSQEAEFLDPAKQKAQEINDSAKASQDKIDGLTNQIDSKLQQYQTLLKEIEGLDVYNGQLQKQIGNQEQEMLDLNASIDEVSVIERQITPLMIRMIDGLEQFVALDVPFLPAERQERLASLRLMMDQANVAPSEKFRRVMEAYQVEMDYGRTIEAYSGFQSINGDERDVDFLRVGRTALVYQSRDGSVQGVWNKQTRQWDALDSSYRTEIAKGMRMARKQLPPGLLMAPVAITD